MDNKREERLAHTFVALSDTLVDDFDMLDFLSLLSERAAELLNVNAAGVVLSDQRGGWRLTAASSEEAQLLELLTTQTHEGPCQECIRDGAAVTSSDLSSDAQRWPRFTKAALATGYRAASAVPMRLRRDCIGALTLLNAEPVGVDEASTQVGQALADVATIGILHHRAVRRGEVLSEQLQAALHHRVVVEQAKGVLAEYGDVTMQQAFQLLRGYARDTGQHLSHVARGIAEGATKPNDLLEHHVKAKLPAQS